MKFHELCNLFPLMEGEEYESLKEDIHKNGQEVPITVFQDQIVDGRNRYRACKDLGIEPKYQEWKGNGSLVAFVLSLNLERRHLKSDQRACIAVDALPMLQKEAKERQQTGKSADGEAGGRSRKKPCAKFCTRFSEGKSRQHAAKLTKTNHQYVSDAARLKKEDPETFEKVRSGKLKLHHVMKERKKDEKIKQMEQLAAEAKKKGIEPDIRCCSMQELLKEVRNLDAIITDPPYSKEFLHLYEDLAKLAKVSLKEGGVLAVMCGQSYLPEILALMTKHIQYRWTIAYLTPGGQSAQLWQREINTFWKPVLIFGKSKGWIGDVVKSDVNDNDKRFHDWGQSESGMSRLLEILTRPGDKVCDPFLGAGTTGVVCVLLNREFLGCDQDEKSVEIAKTRIAACIQERNQDE